MSRAERQTWNGTALAPESFAEDADGALLASVAFAVLRAPSDPNEQGAPVFFAPAAMDANWRGALDEHPLYAWCQAQASAKNTSAETTCGRPLGIRVKGLKLYVCDAYFGVFSAQLNGSSQTEWLVKPDDATPSMRFFNDLDVDSGGTVYFTDSSNTTTRRNNRLLITNNPGEARLLQLRPGASKPEVILSGGHFFNGVQLLPGESALVVVELGRLRLLRCSLPVKAGAVCEPKVFAEALPGVPDNVRLSRDNSTLLVGCALPTARPFSLLVWVWTHQRAARIMGTLLSRLPRERAFAVLEKRAPVGGMVLRLGLDGAALEALHDPTAQVPLISEAHEASDGALWLGSASNAFAARLPPR